MRKHSTINLYGFVPIRVTIPDSFPGFPDDRATAEQVKRRRIEEDKKADPAPVPAVSVPSVSDPLLVLANVASDMYPYTSSAYLLGQTQTHTGSFGNIPCTKYPISVSCDGVDNLRVVPEVWLHETTLGTPLIAKPRKMATLDIHVSAGYRLTPKSNCRVGKIVLNLYSEDSMPFGRVTITRGKCDEFNHTMQMNLANGLVTILPNTKIYPDRKFRNHRRTFLVCFECIRPGVKATLKLDRHSLTVFTSEDAFANSEIVTELRSK